MQHQGNSSPAPPAQASNPFAATWSTAYGSAIALVRYHQIRLTLEHWAALWSDSGWPMRKRLDPLAMPAALEHVFVMDYDADRSTLTYRLVGDAVRTNYEERMRDRGLHDVVAEEAYPSVADYFLACVTRPALVMLTGRLYHERRRPGLGQRLLAPLFDAQGRTAGLLGVTVCEHFFISKEDAALHSRRTLTVHPLDGGEPESREY